MERAWRIVGSGLTKMRDKITKYYENIEFHGPKVIKKKVIFFPVLVSSGVSYFT